MIDGVTARGLGSNRSSATQLGILDCEHKLSIFDSQNLTNIIIDLVTIDNWQSDVMNV